MKMYYSCLTEKIAQRHQIISPGITVPPQFRAAEIITCKLLMPRQCWIGARGK